MSILNTFLRGGWGSVPPALPSLRKCPIAQWLGTFCDDLFLQHPVQEEGALLLFSNKSPQLHLSRTIHQELQLPWGSGEGQAAEQKEGVRPETRRGVRSETGSSVCVGGVG